MFTIFVIFNFCIVFTLPKTKSVESGLPFGENCVIVGLLLLKVYYSVTNRWTDMIIAITLLSRADVQ